MLSITLIPFFSFSCYVIQLSTTKLIQYQGENNIAQGRRAEAKKGVQCVQNKTVMAFLLGKLEQLFYLAHSFAFFLGEI